MKPEDVKPGMEFAARDISSYWVVVESVDTEDALCQYFTCFSGGVEIVNLKQLTDDKIFIRIR